MRLRRLIPILAGLVALVSSVAAVSAFEAHTINVTAHVENALLVDTLAVAYGTVFPQEFIKETRTIDLSDSFKDQNGNGVADDLDAAFAGRVNQIKYEVFVECKPTAVTDIFFPWLLGVYLGIQDYGTQSPSPIDGLTSVGDSPDVGGDTTGPSYEAEEVSQCTGSTFAKQILTDGTLHTKAGDPTTTDPAAQTDDLIDTLEIAIDVPVFEGFYNPLTDVFGCQDAAATSAGTGTKPSGLCVPTAIIGDTAPDHRYFPDGNSGTPGSPIDFIMGLDIKIQVVCIGANDGDPSKTVSGSSECFNAPDAG